MNRTHEFINWVNENGFSSMINVTNKDSKGEFLDITANRMFKIYLNDQSQAEKEFLKIQEFKFSLLSDLEKEQLKFEEEYKKLNPFNWKFDLSKRPDGSYFGEIAFYAFKYWLIRAYLK